MKGPRGGERKKKKKAVVQDGMLVSTYSKAVL